MDNEKKTLEESFQELEEIIKKMEETNTELEESFALYQRGVELLRSVNNRIDRIEKKVMKLKDDGSLEEMPPMTSSYGMDETEED